MLKKQFKLFLEIKIINKKVLLLLNLILEDLHLLGLQVQVLNLLPLTNFFNQPNKNFSGKNKKTNDSKKNTPKKSTLKPQDDDFGKINVNKILEQEEQEFDKFPSLAKLKRAREKEKLQSKDDEDNNKVGKEIIIPEIITVQDLANRMAEKTADVVKTLMKMGVMANQLNL